MVNLTLMRCNNSDASSGLLHKHCNFAQNSPNYCVSKGRISHPLSIQTQSCSVRALPDQVDVI